MNVGNYFFDGEERVALIQSRSKKQPPYGGGRTTGVSGPHAGGGGPPHRDLVPICMGLHALLADVREPRASWPDELDAIHSLKRHLLKVVRLALDRRQEDAELEFELASIESRELIEIFGPIRV